MPTVRTTMRPDQPIEVDAVEYADLKTQGLLVEDSSAPAVPSATAAPANPKKPSAAGSKES